MKKPFLNSQPQPKPRITTESSLSTKGKKECAYQMRDHFGKGMEGSYSKPYQILKKNVNKNHWAGAVQDAHYFLLQSDTAPSGEGAFRLMACDLDAGPFIS